jgi:glycosyltransferase involved in cell wall biosynthesis
MKDQKIILFFAKDADFRFSGQRIATEMMILGLKDLGYDFLEVHTPVFNRIEIKKNVFFRIYVYIKFACKLIIIWLRGLYFTLNKRNIVYINLAQSTYGMIRDGFPLLVRNFIQIRGSAVISLHGSVFLGWESSALPYKILRFLASQANFITVLGPAQKAKLKAMGIPSEKIVIIDNTCLIDPLPESSILKKHTSALDQGEKLKILFLSALLEPKGYIEFIEAVKHLATSKALQFDAFICGPIRMDGSEKFKTYLEAKLWLEEQVAVINQSDSVRLNWIDGIYGEEKTKMLHDAHIFVFPSRYKVEAQPLSLIEALASGCAVITTEVGEIRSTVDQTTAMILDCPDALTIAASISKMCVEHQIRINLSLAGLKLFQSRFSFTVYIEKWHDLFSKIQKFSEH